MATCEYSQERVFVNLDRVVTDRVFVQFVAPTKIRDLLTAIPSLEYPAA